MVPQHLACCGRRHDRGPDITVEAVELRGQVGHRPCTFGDPHLGGAQIGPGGVEHRLRRLHPLRQHRDRTRVEAPLGDRDVDPVVRAGIDQERDARILGQFWRERREVDRRGGRLGRSAGHRGGRPVARGGARRHGRGRRLPHCSVAVLGCDPRCGRERGAERDHDRRQGYRSTPLRHHSVHIHATSTKYPPQVTRITPSGRPNLQGRTGATSSGEPDARSRGSSTEWPAARPSSATRGSRLEPDDPGRTTRCALRTPDRVHLHR